MIKRLFLLSLIFVSITSFSQRKISGRLSDSKTSKTVKNVYVTAQGSDKGTFTNLSGFFEIDVNDKVSKKLVISHVAYGVSEIEVPVQDILMAKLNRLTSKLPDVDLRSYEVTKHNLKTETVDQQSSNTLSEPAHVEGGEIVLVMYLGNKIAMNEQINDKILSSSVDTQFTIANDGSVTNVVVKGDTLPGIGHIIKSALLNMPKWKPALQHNEPCDQDFKMKILYGNLIFTVVEHPASFPGENPGEMKLFYKYVDKNLVYPKEAKAKKIRGSVFVEFVVDKQGVILNDHIKVVKGLGYGLDEEAMRLIKNSGTWNSAIQNNKAVFQTMIVPIHFK